MRESRELPRTQVSGEKQNSFAAGQRALEVFESFVHDRFADVLARVFGEQADFGNLAAKRCEYPAQNFLSLPPALFRKRQLQVAHAHTPELGVQEIDSPGNRNSGGTG